MKFRWRDFFRRVGVSSMQRRENFDTVDARALMGILADPGDVSMAPAPILRTGPSAGFTFSRQRSGGFCFSGPQGESEGGTSRRRRHANSNLLQLQDFSCFTLALKFPLFLPSPKIEICWI